MSKRREQATAQKKKCNGNKYMKPHSNSLIRKEKLQEKDKVFLLAHCIG